MTVDDLKCLLDDLIKSGNDVSVYDVVFLSKDSDDKDKQTTVLYDNITVDDNNQTLVIDVRGIK